MLERFQPLDAPPARKQRLEQLFVVSADSHAHEPHDLWTTRIDHSLRDRVPHVRVDADGRRWMMMEGFRPARILDAPRDASVVAADIVASAPSHEGRPILDRSKGINFQPYGHADVKRYADLDLDGVNVEIVFPNKGLANWSSPDPVLQTAMCRVYNDWAHEVFGRSSRSFPVACIAPVDTEAAVREVERVAALGFHAVAMPPLLREGGYNLPCHEPLWAALAQAGLPVCFHAGTGKDPRTAQGHGGAIINYVVHAMNTVVQPVVELCASGVFDRHPGLRFVTVEAGIGWIPYTLWAMDHGQDKHAFWVSPKLQGRPSDYFRRHGHATFQDDPVGIEMRQHIGIDAILWGNDYPHLEGCWPWSDRVVSDLHTSLNDGELAQVMGLNAARLFNIPVPTEFYRSKPHVPTH
ncbi:MAG: amidohydrolase family protein [Burkholderiaceae bacterium]|nr:amidohydrolase family protein [Burkholderiaceae bacterium]MDO9089042.1 amidohydrolase family protein [Burkholderiaceae bacterium]